MSRQGHEVVLTQRMAGGNTYAILLDSTAVGLLAAELVRLASRAALADVMGAVGALIAEESPALPAAGPTLVA